MKRLFVFLILILLFMESCIKDYEYSADYSPMVTVNCLLIANKPVVLTVSMAKGITDDYVLQSELVPDAFVKIYDNKGNGVVLDTTHDVWNYLYFIPDPFNTLNLMPQTYKFVYANDNFIVKPGMTYYLEVYVKGFDTIYSKTTVPSRVPVVDSFFRTTMDEYDITINDTIRDSYYFIQADNFYSSDPAVISSLDRGVLLDSRRFTGNVYNFNLVLSLDPRADTGKVFMFIVNDDFANYYISLSDQAPDEINNPYEEPAMVYSNINNGTGIFAAVSYPLVLKIPVTVFKR